MGRPRKIQELGSEQPEEKEMQEAKPEAKTMSEIQEDYNAESARQFLSKPSSWVETYHWVKFQQKSNPNEQESVQLTVNGECLLIERGVPVPLPKRFLENADHTQYATYHQEPGLLRKIASYVTTFPYEMIRPATKEEFETFKAEGTRKTKENLVKEGIMDKRELG